MTEIQNPKQKKQSLTRRRRLRRVLNIGICDLFVIWCLEFVILDTKFQGRAFYLYPGPNDWVFQGKIKGEFRI
jgi:hypothetical protein